MFKKQLNKGVSLSCNKYEDFLWIKLCKHFFGIDEDIFLGCVYLPPDRNKRDRYMEILEKCVTEYSNKGRVFLLGD